MVEITVTGDELWDRIERAVEKVKDRMRRVCGVLDAAGLPYAVIGGNAVQMWVSQVDEAAVRNTRDVDLLLERSRFDETVRALEAEGFVYRHAKSVDMFLDGPGAKARDAVHVLFAGEPVRADDPAPAPSIENAAIIDGLRTIPLASLVQMKLTSYRRKDQVHLLDMIDVGLIDSSWPAKYPQVLSERLQKLLDDPDG